MSKGKQSHRRRDALMAADPTCWYCGVDLVYFNPGPRLHEVLPANFATLEHLNSRNRYRVKRPEQGWIVLACRECNEWRGWIEERLAGKIELQARSLRHGASLTQTIAEALGIEMEERNDESVAR